MTLFWKNAGPVLCGAVICAAVITWQVHKAKATEQQLTEAARVCRARAEAGDAKAESQLAYLYSHGQGVPQDYEEALRWRRKAAGQNYADGEEGLGYMYFYGQGVARDYAEALRWDRKAADQGDPHGQNSVALMYERGLGVSQDYAEALRWYRKAADQGYASAQYNIGNLYYYGRGVPQDRGEAVRWYRKAADQGDESAQRYLHIGWKGLSTFRKINIGITCIGSLFLLFGPLFTRQEFVSRQRKRIASYGLLGLSWSALDLYGLRYLGILTPVLSFAAFSFVKSVVGQTFVVMLLPIVLPKNIWPNMIKVGLGLVGLTFLGVNVLSLMTHSLRHVDSPPRSIWSINGILLGFLLSWGTFLWSTQKRINSELQSADQSTVQVEED